MIEYEFGKSHKSPKEFMNYLESVWHIFSTRNARKSTKGSKNSYSNLKSKKTLSHNIGSLDRMMTSSK